MAQKLRDAIIKSAHGKEFLPLDALKNIVTRRSVDTELRQNNLGDSVSAIDICKRQEIHDPNLSRDRFTSRQKIFATLVLINEVPLIIDFVQHGFTDADLPFHTLKEPRPGQSVYALVPQLQTHFPPSDYKLQTEQHDNGWTSNNIPLFVNQQWAVCAPFFTRAEDIGERAYHLSLSPEDVLPFVEFNDVKDGEGDLGTPSFLLQGAAKVKHVKIHPAHHKFPVKQVRFKCLQGNRYST